MTDNFFDDYNDGSQPATQEKNMDVIGALVNKIIQQNARIANLESLPQDSVEIKTTTGDYTAASSWDGRRVLNTFDNNYKIFAEAAWHQIIAY